MTEQSLRVAIRADASPSIGTGHVMRCLAIADAIRQRHGRVRFVGRHMPDHLRSMTVDRGHEFVAIEDVRSGPGPGNYPHSAWLESSEQADAEATAKSLAGRAWDVIVVDHYALGAPWERALREIGSRILAIDDLADRPHDCDFLLDQGADSRQSGDYADRVPSGCVLLLGPKFALVRSEFADLRSRVRPRNGSIGRVLVFMGGMDAQNHTGLVLEALGRIGRRDFEVDVVIGSQHPRRAQLSDACLDRGYRCHVQTEKMAGLIVAADLGIGSGGTAAWERCCLGLPTLTIEAAANQRRLIHNADRCGLIRAVALGDDPAESLKLALLEFKDRPDLIQKMSARCLREVDGRGVPRAIRALGLNTVMIRKARLEDSAAIWRWRNDPVVRAVSLNQEPIAGDVHQAWFDVTLANPKRELLVGEQEGRPIGVVRFDIAGTDARVSIYLVPGLAGRGLGSELLEASESWLLERRPAVTRILADVRGDNERSHALFRAAGYVWSVKEYQKAVRGR